MELKIFVSLALCTLVSGRPGLKTNDGLQKAISNLQLLIPRIIEDTLAEDDGIRQSLSKSHQHHADSHESYLVPKSQVSYLAPNSQSAYLVPNAHASDSHESHLVPNSLESYLLANSQGSYSVPKAHASFHASDSPESHLVPDSHESYLVPNSHESYVVANSQGSYLVPKAHASFHSSNSHDSYPSPRAHATPPKPNGPQYYLDGAFSDIPNTAFILDEHLAERHEITKKDMAHSRRPHRKLHLSNNNNLLTNNLHNVCLDLFRGKAQVRGNSLEVMLNVCGELLDLEGLEIFEPRVDNNRYLFDHNGLVGLGCCAPAHHTDAGLGGHHHHEISSVLDYLKASNNAEADHSLSDEDRGDEVKLLAEIIRWLKPLESRRE